MSPKKEKISSQLSEIVKLFSEKTYKNATDTLEQAMHLLKKDPLYKDGVKYIDKFSTEIKKTGTSMERKIKTIVDEERKKIAYSLINLGKYLDNLGEAKTTTKKTTKKKTVKKKEKKS